MAAVSQFLFFNFQMLESYVFLHVWKRDPTHLFWLEVFWGAVGWPWAALGLPGRVLISRPRGRGGVWQWGLAVWVSRHAKHVCLWDWRRHDGWGELGYTPTPCVDAAVANWGFIM